MAKKSGVNFKQMLTQKGEKVGFFACAALLIAFLGLGGYVASRAASSGDIVKDIDTKVASVRSKTTSGPGEPPPLDPAVFTASAKMPRIPFTEYPTENDFFNVAEDQQQKRMNPKIFPLIEAQIDFVRGSMPVLEIVDDPQLGRLIGILATKAATKNYTRNIKIALDPRRRQAAPPPVAPAPRPPQPPPGVPGGPGLPPGAGGGGRSEGGGGRMEGGVPGTASLGGQTAQSSEMEVKYKSIDDKDIDAARFAENILPKRMVVINAAIPYRKQLEEYARALRARFPQELDQRDLPLYRGYKVQRQTWSADRKNLITDWEDIDLRETVGKLFVRVLEFEPETYPKDPQLAPYYPRLMPDPSTKLVMPRPKLKRGEYKPTTLPSVDSALKVLEKAGGNAGQFRTKSKDRLEEDDPFAQAAATQPATSGVTGMPPSDVVGGTGGGGRPVPGRPRLEGGRPGPGDFNAEPVVAEDVWMMRFIDVTVQPGQSYRYQIQLKVANPNYRRPVKELAIPKYAEDEELLSPWFRLPDAVDVPSDEFLYAAAKDERGRRVTEKLVQETPDTTYFQVQRWSDFVRPNPAQPRMEPIGEWLVADIKALRGQFVGETTRIKVPFWSMTANSYLFREVLPPKAPSSGVFVNTPKPRLDATWPINFAPLPQMLLVDFQGGNGTYPAGKRQIADQSSVEMLLLGDDGKLTVKRSQPDLDDQERRKREESWQQWLAQVQAATDEYRSRTNQPPPGSAPGVPGGGTGPGGSSGGSGQGGSG